MDKDKSSAAQGKLLALLQYEEMLRTSQDKSQLGFRAVNECRPVLSYRQAFIFYGDKSTLKLEAASSLASFDNTSPFVRWINSEARKLVSQSDSKIQIISRDQLNETDKNLWDEHALPHALWCPLVSPTGQLVGGLWFSRESAWIESELPIVERIRNAVGHSVWAMCKPPAARKVFNKKVGLITLAILLLGMFLPVRMSVLAPVEVVATRPAIISSGVEGVVAEILVQANQSVKKGDLLLQLDATELENQVKISNKELEVRQAQLLTAAQGAFSSRESKAQLAILREEITLAKAQLEYHQDRLNKSSIRAPKTGLLIYSDMADWIGRPVKVGERIMQIADPTDTQFRIDVPLADSLVLAPDSEVRVFLNANPLNPLEAIVENASYEAQEVTAGQLAYRVTAKPTQQYSADQTRIGFRGTAKIYGQRVPLFYYLFRRPLTTARQYLGL